MLMTESPEEISVKIMSAVERWLCPKCEFADICGSRCGILKRVAELVMIIHERAQSDECADLKAVLNKIGL